ncbi:MAG: hypothetical protein AABW68_05160 [archaeon]
MYTRNLKILLLSLAGFLFAGYLTYSKVITGTCPLTEGCPYLFGLPTCVYGALFFGILLLASIIHHLHKTQKYQKVIQWVSVAGILFSGYYSIQEIFFPSCIIQPCTYSLVLPSCVYGLVLYALIAYLAWKK